MAPALSPTPTELGYTTAGASSRRPPEMDHALERGMDVVRFATVVRTR